MRRYRHDTPNTSKAEGPLRGTGDERFKGEIWAKAAVQAVSARGPGCHAAVPFVGRLFVERCWTNFVS